MLVTLEQLVNSLQLEPAKETRHDSYARISEHRTWSWGGMQTSPIYRRISALIEVEVVSLVVLLLITPGDSVSLSLLDKKGMKS
jgi:hypothetical protein